MDGEFEPLSTRLRRLILPTKITLIVCLLDAVAVSLVCLLSSADLFLFAHLLAIVLSTSITTTLLVMYLQRVFHKDNHRPPLTSTSSASPLPPKTVINFTS
uniref:Uncharacterized protein n=1 Tax=Plectus sambesii TaxID=2011161 RepID=A0A914V2E9_9BILA